MSGRRLQEEAQRFAHYRLGKVLGEGGFGRVHAAWDERLAREVAIKFTGTDRRQQEGLRYEAQRLASQRHRAFVNVFALEERRHELAMVMELVRGRTLAQALAQAGSLRQEHLLRLGVEAAAALAETHRSGWVHGDIKPSNLMLADDGTLRILDFGAATSIDPFDTLSMSSVEPPAGTLAYMAPERLLGAKASARGDIYSLGLVLYEAVTRRLVAGDEDATGILRERLYGREDGWTIPAHCDAGLRSLIERMTRRHVARRPVSMEQVHSELIRLQASQRPGVPVRRQRRVVASGMPSQPVPTPGLRRADAATIRLSFDVEQVGTDLLWRASDSEGDREIYPATGRYAGTMRLRDGEPVTVEVTGYGAAGRMVSTNLLDAVLHTVPLAAGAGRSPSPSPFSHVRAITPIEQWSPVEIHRYRGGKLAASVQRSLTPLQVVQKHGRWKLSLVLTVSIARHADEGRFEEVRVFSFSAEAEVDAGEEPSGRPRRTRAQA